MDHLCKIKNVNERDVDTLRLAFDNQVLTLNALIEVNKAMGIDTSNPENIIFPDIVRDENNVVRVNGGDAAPKCDWTASL